MGNGNLKCEDQLENETRMFALQYPQQQVIFIDRSLRQNSNYQPLKQNGVMQVHPQRQQSLNDQIQNRYVASEKKSAVFR